MGFYLGVLDYAEEMGDTQLVEPDLLDDAPEFADHLAA